jgi:hypothetical protein
MAEFFIHLLPEENEELAAIMKRFAAGYVLGDSEKCPLSVYVQQRK